jgi:hypothetical protein
MDEPQDAEARAAAVAAIWGELREHVEARFRGSSDEVRRYPTPIARCDEQLTALIEQRDRARQELERALAVDTAQPRGERPVAQALQQFLAVAGAADDDTGLALRCRLQAALELR